MIEKQNQYAANTDTPEPEKQAKTPDKREELKRYDDIEQAWKGGHKLFLTELTILRNLAEKNISKKDFGVIKTVSLVGAVDPKNPKRLAGIYRKADFKEREEDAEALVMNEDYENGKVLIVTRNSPAVDQFA